MLDGVKVLSFTHYLQGPSAVQMLADLGADVVKIESPAGAFERHWSGADAYKDEVSVFFLLGNRNQRSLSINLRAPEGKEIIYRLIQETDIIVENFRPGVMDRLGLGYEKIKELNPRLIYCSCTGYGSDGPYEHRPGQDMLIQAMSGLTNLSGTKDAAPTPVGTAVVDQHAAVLAAFGIVSALFDRVKTGKGKKIESNLLNAALDLQIEPLSYHLNMGSLRDRSETGIATRFHQAPYGVYSTANGWIALSMSPAEKLAEVFGCEALKGYSGKDQMYKHEEVNAIVIEELKKKTTKEWYTIFDEHGIWYAPVNGYEEVEKDPQVKWNKMILTVDHPDVGEIRLLNHPVRYDGEGISIRKSPPRLGEHSAEVLQEIGYTEEQIEKLLQNGIVNDYQKLKGVARS